MELLEQIFGSIPRLLLPTVSLVCRRWQTAVHGLAVRHLTGCLESGLTEQQQLERWGWSTAAAAWQHATRSCSCIRLAFHFFTRDETPVFQTVFRIHIFLGLPDPLVRGMDPVSGSFYHQAKIVRKTFFLPFCDFF
jgi:hypothetical protein